MNYLTYLRLAHGTQIDELVDAMQKIANEPIKEHIHYGYTFDLVPIKDIHTGRGLRGDLKVNVDPVKLNILTLVGGFVLLLGWINFINLTTATALGRAKETGLRKVLGSSRKQLIWQFLFESLVTGVLAFLAGSVIYYLSFPLLSSILPVSDPWFWFNEPERVAILLGLVLSGSLITGIYPALILSGFQPSAVLRGPFKSSGKGVAMRKVLVVLQSAITVFLFTGLMAVVWQVDFMLNNDLGMEPSHVIVVPKPGNLQVITDNRITAEDLFKDALETVPALEDFAVANVLPGSGIRWKTDLSFTAGHEEEVETRGVFAQNYLNTLGIDLVAGRDFLDNTIETDAAILNESAVKALGYSTPQETLGVSLYVDGRKRTVVGVMEDYHHENLKEDISPMVLRTKPRGFDYFFLRLNSKNLPEHLDAVEEVFLNTFPGNPFHFFFLEEHLEQNYLQDRQFGRSFGVFAILTALIAGIGLYSLSSFVSLMRQKEIGVRKVLGASISKLMLELNASFIRLILLSLLFAIPLSVWVVESWLDSFPYRIALNLKLYVLPGVGALIFGLIVVSFNTLSASLNNPVNLLRNE